MSQDYEIIEKFEADGDIPITLCQNKVTGLKIATIQCESPIVKGDIVFATEAFDDDGLPHTLEHLIFLGSEDYPYKGVLDILANKCLSHGTNAMTDTDNTSYQLTTAGTDGFLKLLPVYLDHLFYPKLTEAAYITEVHHINSEGENAGVVYCEVQGVENTGDTRCYTEMAREMYPTGGYKSVTGGILENLRTSTSNAKCREYHKEFYHSMNACIIATGPIEVDAIIKAIKPIEDKIVAKGDIRKGFVRPWQSHVDDLPKSVEKIIQYSSDTDEDGLVYIGFRGPKGTTEMRNLRALRILLEYLNSTAISPIQKEFVECDEPYCSSIYHSIIENSVSCIYLCFESVGKEYLKLVSSKLFKLLKNIQAGREPIDMDRMKTTISRRIVEILSMAESSPHSLVGSVIGHFLYGNGTHNLEGGCYTDKSSTLEDRSKEIPNLEEFLSYAESDWRNLIDQYFTGENSRYVTIVGEPSPEFMKNWTAKEKQRLDKQKADLSDKLPELGKCLKEAIEQNDKPSPQNLFDSVTSPNIEDIRFHSIERGVLGGNDLPFRFQYDSIKTNFVTIQLLCNTSKCQKSFELRLCQPLIAELLFESPIYMNGSLVSHEQVVASLMADTVTYRAHNGLSNGAFLSVLSLSMQLEIRNYTKGVEWLKNILYNIKFSQERIKTVATRMVNDITQEKRSGSKVAGGAMNGLVYDSDSNEWALNFMRQQKYLKRLLKELKTNPDEVEQRFSKILSEMTRPDNILVHVTYNKSKLDLESICKPWHNFVSDVAESKTSQVMPQDILPSSRFVNFVDEPKAAILGIGGVESNFLQRVVKSIDDPCSPDVAPVRVLISYLTQLEGPLWRQVRGLGLAYSYGIHLTSHEGLICFNLYRSTRVLEAYRKTIEILDKFINGEEEFEDNLLLSAKSSLTFDLIKPEKSAYGKSIQSLVAHLRSLDMDHNKNLIREVFAVTKDDLRRVGPKYLKPLFDPSQDTRTSLCCNPSNIDELVKGFQAVDCNFEPVSLEHAKFMNSMKFD